MKNTTKNRVVVWLGAQPREHLYSVGYIATALGSPESTVRKVVKELYDGGKLACLTMKDGTRIYRLVTEDRYPNPTTAVL